MKVCSKCKKCKPRTDFSIMRRASDGLQGSCKTCMNEAGKKNYQENKDRYFKVAKSRDAELDKLIFDQKNQPCADCGIKYPPYVMDFDHLEAETKEFNISGMRRRRMAFQKILDEISKCEVVCSNCHRMRTNARNPSRYTKATLYEKDF